VAILSVRRGFLVWLSVGSSLVLARLASPQLPSSPRSGTPSLEYQVKAAYLLNFTRYVEWPAEVFDTPGDPVTICVLGQDPFGSVLDATLRGRRTQGRTASVRRIDAVAETSGCHLVFVSRETWRNQPDLPRRLRAVGMLTVGESDEFAQQGGVIAFIIQNEAVRFVVNARARDRAGLRISSRMLSLAAAVYGQESGS
jgi:YfiR/HmsC-like